MKERADNFRAFCFSIHLRSIYANLSNGCLLNGIFCFSLCPAAFIDIDSTEASLACNPAIICC